MRFADELRNRPGWFLWSALIVLVLVARLIPASDHWAFKAPIRNDFKLLPTSEWTRNPIDQFVLATLQDKQIPPSPEANGNVLIRRLYLDLIGLPPRPEEVEAFLRDDSPNAYERIVDQLLASAHFGEQWGRHWLDLARYADSDGYEKDGIRPYAYLYRDWVIDAINRDLEYDQFSIEQLAGDLLPNATLDQKIATGFNRCNITTNEGGAINEEYLVLYTRDRTETVSQVWMGLTAGCAVCHDHKFDPVSQKDFYSLAAFFNNTTQAAMDGNIPNTPPILPVPLPADRPRFEQLGKEIAAAK